MRFQRPIRLVLTFLATVVLTGSFSSAQPLGLDHEILVCPLLHAKAMPQGFPVAAMKFTGPSGDGRRGSAGFVVQSQDIAKGTGTRWKFIFQRDASGYGFQVIHPFEKGHVLLSVHSRGVTIHRGGVWGSIGWGNPSTSDKVLLTAAAAEILPLKDGVPYQVISQLTDGGEYQLWIDDTVICRHEIEAAEPLLLNVPPNTSLWGGSVWDRTPFSGEGFNAQLETGHAGLILGPMDGSGPTQFFKQVTLSGLVSTQAKQEYQHVDAPHFDSLFADIDGAREFDKLKRSKTVGGSKGTSFETIPDQPSLLIGFKYTTSTFYGGHLTVKAMRPIFRGRDGESIGDWHGVPHGKVHQVKAKDGYVVAGIVAKSGHRLDGLRLIFMRVKNGYLNPDDTYRSKWVGGRGGGRETLVAVNGDPVIGIFGRHGEDIDALGFVQVAAK